MQMGFLRAALLSAVFAVTAACQTTAVSRLPAVQPLDAELAQQAARSEAPGLVAAVYRDGRLTEVYTWGGADCAGQGAVNAFADYEVGSISKQMTAVAILRLWDAGRLDINATLGTYLNDVPDAWKRVTLRQLLTHTSGVPDYEEAGGYGVYETSPTPQQVFDIVRARPLDFEPGTQWNYSNTGYFLLSLIIERVTGRHFGDYMRDTVFAPLHMDHTFVSGYAPAGAVIAQGCKPGDGPGAARISVRPISEASTFGAGGILSTVEDWGKWYDALNSGRLLSPRAMQAMFTATILPDGTNTGYGMAMEIDDFRGEPRRGHTGQTQGFVADYESFQNRHVAILILTNQYEANPFPLAQALLLRVMPDLSYDRLQAAPDPDVARTALVRRAIRQMILAEEPPFDLLGARLKTFPTDPQYAPQRARLHDVVAGATALEFVRNEPLANPGPERLLYRATAANGDRSYFMVSWANGQLVGLRWFPK